MTVWTTKTIEFASCKKRKVQVNFGGGEITSDAGVMLLSQADKKLKLTERIAPILNDLRCQGKCKHSTLDLLASGYTPSPWVTKISTITTHFVKILPCRPPLVATRT